MIEGIDVSRWQREMNFAKAYQAGARFAFIRAGSITSETGECYEDYQFRRNAEIGPEFMPCGFYWYMRPKWNAKKQSDYFLNLLASHAWGQALDTVCDIERPGPASAVEEFCEDGVNMIYSNLNTVKYLLTGDTDWMEKYRLWLADWDAFGNVIEPWSEWIVWQTGPRQDGYLYGADSNAIDHNWATDKLFTVEPEPPDPPPPWGEKYFPLEVVQEGLNIRTGPGTNYADIGDLHKGDIVHPSDIGGSSAWVEFDWAGGKAWSNVQYGVDRNMEPVEDD